jgi:histidinol-phosphate aminotransferase
MSFKPTRREWVKMSAMAAAAVAFAGGGHDAVGQNGAGLIKLSGNENPYGPSPKARKALADALTGANRYVPPETLAQLESMIAEREGVKPESVVAATGSGEILCMAAVAFGKKEIVAPTPTFPTLMRYAELLGATVRNVPLTAAFEHDLAAMRRAVSENTSIVFTCNPNNPTGGLTPNSELRSFITETSKRVPVFSAEAYPEYTDDFPRNSMIDLVRAGENVIVSRTFSKIYGMAGLRVGYGIAKPELAARLRRYRMTWLNNTSIAAAIAAYADQAFVAESKKRNEELRGWFLKELDTMGVRYAPTVSNFAWVNIGTGVQNYTDRMREKGFLMGRADNGWTRVTIGTADEMRKYVAALKQIRS